MLEEGDDAIGHAQLRRPAPTLVRLSSSQASTPEGEPLTLAARVRTLDGDATAPSGAVQFRVGPQALGSAPLDLTGEAVLRGVRLGAGVHAITAAYAGDAAHAAATSAPLPQAVTVAAAPVVVLVCAPTEVVDGILLEAELVDPHTGRLAEDASGVVHLTAAGTHLVCADLIAGHARAVIGVLPSGRFGASFPGDAEHAAASGVLLEQDT